MKKFIGRYAEHYLKELLLQADIIIDGDRPWDINVNNSNFYQRVVFQGSLGFGESYVEKLWDCKALDQLVYKILKNDLHRKMISNIPDFLNSLKSRMLNCQSRNRAFQVGEEHYDVGNDIFELMLDKYMTYSCGYWRYADTLEEAQRAKLDIICKKLKLAPGMRLLDIGCGWGSLLSYAAKHYGVEAVGITVSKEQVQIARQRCSGLPVEVLLQDYREITGTFDAIASVGMLEHVGYKNYSCFMKVVNQHLQRKGLFLLHTIGSNRSELTCDLWFDKYIFPNGMLPSIAQVGYAAEEDFVMEDWHNLGIDYDKTLMAWYQNFEKRWPEIKTHYPEHFFRMWRYYLLAMAGSFRARHIQVWQIVLSPEGSVQTYAPIRCPKCDNPTAGNKVLKDYIWESSKN